MPQLANGLLSNTVLITSPCNRTAYANVAGKYQDVLTLEQSVAELHQMFLDFALLTEQQGELLDQIEYQVRSAADYIEDANVDVHEAIEYQKKIRKKQWCVPWGVVIVRVGLSKERKLSSLLPLTHISLFIYSALRPTFHQIQLDHPHCYHTSHHCAILDGNSSVAPSYSSFLLSNNTAFLVLVVVFPFGREMFIVLIFYITSNK